MARPQIHVYYTGSIETEGNLITDEKQKQQEQHEQHSVIDSSEAEMITLRIGGKWQSIPKELLNQARQVMKTLTPLERKVMQLYFGLPEEYFEECD